MIWKNNIIAIPIFCFLAIGSIKAQNSNRLYSGADLRPAVGFNMSSSDYSIGEPTDYLIEDNFNSFYWQPLAGSFFIVNNFGFEFSASGFNYEGREQAHSQFEESIKDQYGENYFLSFQLPTNYSQGIADLENIYFGPVIRFQNKKFQWKFKLLLGWETIQTPKATVTLKEKNSHTVLKLDYQSPQNNSSNNTICPSASIAYRLFGPVLVNIDLAYSYSEIDFTYSETMTNQITSESVINYYHYQSSINRFSVGVGLTIEIATIKPKSK